MAIIKDRETNRSKGYAFVTYQSSHEADEAVDGANGKVFFVVVILYSPEIKRVLESHTFCS